MNTASSGKGQEVTAFGTTYCAFGVWYRDTIFTSHFYIRRTAVDVYRNGKVVYRVVVKPKLIEASE